MACPFGIRLLMRKTPGIDKPAAVRAYAIHDIFIEILIDEQRDHGMRPFARARFCKSSLVTRPLMPAASSFFRTASASSSQWRRYLSNGVGSAR